MFMTVVPPFSLALLKVFKPDNTTLPEPVEGAMVTNTLLLPSSLITPLTSMLWWAAAEIVRTPPLTSILSAIVSVSGTETELAVAVMSPPRSSRLPDSVNWPVFPGVPSFENRIAVFPVGVPRPTRRLVKSLVVVVRVSPPNRIVSLVTGTPMDQFPAVLQLLSAPPPIHVVSAACAEAAMPRIAARKADFLTAAWCVPLMPHPQKVRVYRF
ncbi:MAG: hypothetical protein NTW36_00180 [Planctomycetia bacterium]|nr:hypothetical protein [Planctomycetia bacterium]